MGIHRKLGRAIDSHNREVQDSRSKLGYGLLAVLFIGVALSVISKELGLLVIGICMAIGPAVMYFVNARKRNRVKNEDRRRLAAMNRQQKTKVQA